MQKYYHLNSLLSFVFFPFSFNLAFVFSQLNQVSKSLHLPLEYENSSPFHSFWGEVLFPRGILLVLQFCFSRFSFKVCCYHSSSLIVFPTASVEAEEASGSESVSAYHIQNIFSERRVNSKELWTTKVK